LLVFGWAYILSVKLVELREKSLEGKVQYTDDMLIEAVNRGVGGLKMALLSLLPWLIVIDTPERQSRF
jgi:hypothetical protein